MPRTRNFFGQPVEIHVRERGRRHCSNYIATGNRPPRAVEFIRPDNHDGISAVQCDTLQASLLDLAHHFALAHLDILKGRGSGRTMTPT